MSTYRNKPLNIAHRGGKSLAPENTLVAFHTALKAGADMLDIDVRITKDGHLVAIHDRSVERTTNSQGKVEELPLSYLKTLDAGYRFTNDGKTYPYRGKGVTIPTLKEIFLEFPNQRFNIHLSSAKLSIIEPLVKLVKKMKKTEQVTVASFHSDIIIKLRTIDGNIHTAATWCEIFKFYSLRRFVNNFRLGATDELQVPLYFDWRDNGGPKLPVRFVTKGFIEEAHQRGLKVYVWTVDDEPTMELLVDWNVDGIITNRPNVLQEVLNRKFGCTARQ